MKAKTNIILPVTISAILFVILLFSLHAPLSYAAAQRVAPQNPFAGQTIVHAPASMANSSSASLNWAGYVADSGQYTAVTGSWVVPTVSAGTAQGRSASGLADATWVGIGGVHADDLIQAGTQALVGRGGAIEYQAWYETLPNVSTPVSLAVSPGDSMTTTLSQTGPSQWHITIRDNTTGGQYDNTIAYASSLSSAEWVEERVSDVDGSFWPLDDFGSVKFFNTFATENGTQQPLSALDAQPLSMLDGAGVPLATTSDIDSTGSFTVARADASSAPAPAYAVSNPNPEPQVVNIAPDSGSAPGYLVITFGPGGISISGGSANADANASLQRPSAASHHRRVRM